MKNPAQIFKNLTSPATQNGGTIAAPSANIYSAYIQLQDNDTYGDPIYKSAGGTSMAAPHVSGALGVILSRYPYMTTDQARDVMLTTARQTTLRKGLEGKPLERLGNRTRCT